MSCPCWAPAKYGHDDSACDERRALRAEIDEAIEAVEELLRLPETSECE